jgi:regulator of cell morphogenesis and NO signaling
LTHVNALPRESRYCGSDRIDTMSHKKNVFSPPGTPVSERTVGELVAERPGRSRVFQTFGIDFCCQGGRTLREACERKGASLETVIEQLEAESATPSAEGRNPATLPIPELAAYIVEKHHRFLDRELPRLYAMSQRVAQVHGGHTPSLVDVFHVFTQLEEEMQTHMMKEEKVLFPTVVAMSRGEAPPVPLDEPIECMMHEHEDSGRALERLRELTNAFEAPPDACNTYRALFAGLAELEADLHRHIHLENAVLFPAALKLANL